MDSKPKPRTWAEASRIEHDMVCYMLRKARASILDIGIYRRTPQFKHACTLAIAALRDAARKPPKVSAKVLDHFKDWTPEMVKQFNAYEAKRTFRDARGAPDIATRNRPAARQRRAR